MLRSIFKKYMADYQRFSGAYELIKVQAIEQVAEYRRLHEEMSNKQPDNVALFGSKVYSQTDEDGIIQEIFNRIPNNNTFFEIGIETGIECNSIYLLLKNWRGVWVEGNPGYVKRINKELGGNTFGNTLKVINSFVLKDNVVHLFKQAYQFLGVSEIDFFSLDIDGNDYYIMYEILRHNIFPKVVCVEYNAKFPPPLKIKMKYNPVHRWDYGDYLGCSLQEYADLFQQFNYTLICCNLTGINAFFVRNDFVGLFKIYETQELYQAYKFYLSPILVDQKPSLKYLRDILKDKG